MAFGALVWWSNRSPFPTAPELARINLYLPDTPTRISPLAAEASPAPNTPFTGAPFGKELTSSDLPVPRVHPLEPHRPHGPAVVDPLPPPAAPEQR